MLTQDPRFLLGFYPALLLLFWSLSRVAPQLRVGFLLVASMLFYGLADPRHAPLVGAMVVLNFVLGAAITRARAGTTGPLVAAGCLANIAVLAVYKYGMSPADAAATGNDAAGAGLLQAGLPLGLSFFALKQISWLVDVRSTLARAVGVRDLPRFALYSIFFPQMIAGPVFRYRDAAEEYRLLENRTDPAMLALGLSVFVMGLAKKLLIADPIGGVVDPIFGAVAAGHAPTVAESWAAGWGYLLQLYFDFSGFSDMALGIGLTVGLRLPINFYSPLKARSASEYFDRWHMSLVVFIRTYIFSPIFLLVRKRAPGNAVRRTILASAAATLLSLSLIGWWHGARPTYVLSGFLTGVVAVLFQLAAVSRNGPAPLPNRRRKALGRAVVLLGLTLFAILFRANSLDTAWSVWAGLIGRAAADHHAGAALLPNLLAASSLESMLHLSAPASAIGLLVAAGATLIALAAPNSVQIFDLYDHPGAPARPSGTGTPPAAVWQWRRSPGWSTATALVAAMALAQASNGALSTTIYARF